MKPEQINAIKERAAKATPGTWVVRKHTGGIIDVVSVETTEHHEYLTRIELGEIEDAEFIAHAREDVPALVAEVERLSRGRNISSVQIRQLFGEIERLKTAIRTLEANANDGDFVRHFAKEALEVDS